LSTIERLGSVPGYNTHPKGLNANLELKKIFGSEFHEIYGVPSFTAEDCRKAFERYDKVEACYDPVKLDQATTWVYQIFRPFMQCEFATHQEVIDNMDLSTSPGYPYSLVWPTKRHVFEAIGFDWLDRAFEDWKENPYQGIFKNFLKEEVREIGKDTRGILAGPLDISYFMSRFFLNQNEGFYDSYLLTPSAIGISRDGLDWNRLYHKLARHSKGADLDAKKFDSRMQPILLRQVQKLRQHFLLPHQRWAVPMIADCYDQLIETVCNVEGELVQKSGGNPTGSVNTAPDNTLVLTILLCYAFIVLNPGKSIYDFLKYVAAAEYGDDLTYTWDDAVDMHPERVANVLREAFGYEWTHEGVKNVDDLTFLSAGFEFIQVGQARIAVPKFDREKMVSHIIYGQKKEPSIEFQRVASLRLTNPFDQVIVDGTEEWLFNNRHCVDASTYTALVPPISYVKSLYLTPKKMEPIVFAQGGILNSRSSFNVRMEAATNSMQYTTTKADSGEWYRKVSKVLSSKVGLTSEEIDFIWQRCNTFPDATQNTIGEPDGSSMKSSTYQIQFKQPLALPSGSGITGNFDLFIWVNGNLRQNQGTYTGPGSAPPGFNTVASEAPLVDNVSGGALRFDGESDTGIYPCGGLVSWIYVPAGTPVFPSDPEWTPSSTPAQFGTLDLEDLFSGGPTRLVAGGMEFYDTTATLYQQGTITTGYREQNVEHKWVRSLYSDVASNGVEFQEMARFMSAPPSNLNVAQTTRGAKSWACKDGAYSNFRFCGSSNGYQTTNYEQVVWADSWPISPNFTTAGTGQRAVAQHPIFNFVQTIGVGTAGTQICSEILEYFAPSQIAPVHQQFFYLSNLNTNFSGSLCVNLTFETLPPEQQTILYGTMKPCPLRSDRAVEIANEIMNLLPAAVPVAENASGDWFKKVLSAVSKYATPIGTTLGNLGVPGAGLIGNAAKQLADVSLEHYGNVNRKEAKKVDKKVNKEEKQIEALAQNQKQQQMSKLSRSKGKGKSGPKRGGGTWV
jgi:hypothetical protein